MATLQHSTLPSSSVHEPKHISINGSSASGKVITNHSSTSGISEYRNLVMSEISNVQEVLQVLETDASVSQTHYMAAPFNGDVKSFSAVVNTAVTTSTNTYGLEIDGITVTGSALSITVTPGTGGTAGDVVTVTPSAAFSFTAGQTISIISSATGNTDANLDVRFQLILERT